MTKTSRWEAQVLSSQISRKTSTSVFTSRTRLFAREPPSPSHERRALLAAASQLLRGSPEKKRAGGSSGRGGGSTPRSHWPAAHPAPIVTQRPALPLAKTRGKGARRRGRGRAGAPGPLIESPGCSTLRSSVPMALDVGKSLSETSLSQKAKCYGRWDYTDIPTGCPELADSMHWLLEAEEAKPSLALESLARSGHGCLVADLTQRGSSYCKEAPSAPTSGFPGVPSAPVARAARGGDSHPHLSHRFFSSEEQQQTKTMGCSEPASSAPNAQSSAEESSIADVSHDISTSQCSQRPPSPFSSTLESLPQPTPLSPSRSRSRSSFSTLSLEENSASEQQEVKQSPGLPAEGKAPRARNPLGPLLGERVPVGRVRKMSSYQADYWACAIPDSLPPSPDRQSPHWNPHKEYEDLLDYAYPLRPRYKLGKAPEPFFHDSGIDLDSFSLSPEGTLTSTSVYGQGWQAQGSRENPHRGFGASARRYSTPVSGKPGCVRAISYCEPSAAAKSASSNGTAGPSRGFPKDLRTELAGLSSFHRPDVDGSSWCHLKGSPSSNHKGQAKSTSRFLPTTQVLPLRKEWDGDEEFLSLPPRLRELERLSQILSDLSLTKRTSRQGYQTPPPYSDSQSERSPFRAAGSRDQRERTEGFLGLCHPYSSQKPSWESTGSWSRVNRDPLSGLHLPAGTRSMLDGTCPGELGVKGRPKEKGQQGESLAQCIKMFCCQLEELICWLYDVADLTDSWVPPTPDAASVKAALCRYLEFRKDVADHQSLTESVLQRGEALLECMASNSPALKETLGLIAKQSEELESHAERLYKSVLAAVDPVQGQDREQGDSMRQAAAQWVLPPSDLGFVGCSQDG
ncbi:centrosomal protein of 68 kDa [Oxyura jamaicensis]|uniref:centrosomal protein of 68 kDa n=1 Tax=Oxyura jamaicensis TaxID=8884 RepID=UPI0015A6CBFB|nr:centrosomal protein of 68 kDa [Oxyura jamaicensis]